MSSSAVYHTENTVLNDLDDKSTAYCEGLMEIFRKAYHIVDRVRYGPQLITFSTFLAELEVFNALPHPAQPPPDTLLGIQDAMHYFSHYFHNLGSDSEFTPENTYNIHQNIEENFERLLFRLRTFS
jgi:hypothetical protein